MILLHNLPQSYPPPAPKGGTAKRKAGGTKSKHGRRKAASSSRRAQTYSYTHLSAYETHHSHSKQAEDLNIKYVLSESYF